MLVVVFFSGLGWLDFRLLLYSENVEPPGAELAISLGSYVRR